MPTDAAGEGGDPTRGVIPPEPDDDELVFAAQDLGRDRRPAPAPDQDVDFAIAPRRTADPGRGDGHVGSFVPGGRDAAPPLLPVPATSPSLPADDFVIREFVIREPEGVAPSDPVDALVVGAPPREPAASNGSAPAAEVRPAFAVTTPTAAAPVNSSTEPPWLVRGPARRAAPSASRDAWGTRTGDLVDGSAHATMLRLREEAVDVTWKAAWIAVTSADRKLLRRRDA
jgi:hypothetical protein